LHIGAKQGEIAEAILLPGDPLRAKFIAENFLTDAKCYNEIRGMYGFTGYYKGKRVSVQGTGMGMPSCSIYVYELINEYNVKTLVRIGTAGSTQSYIDVRDIIVGVGACADSDINKMRFGHRHFSPIASFKLLYDAYNIAQEKKLKAHFGNILSIDNYYYEDPDWWKIWAKYNVIGIEMESYALYTLAARYKCDALSILTVSNSFITGEEAPAEDRQTKFKQMAELALDLITK